MAYVLILFPLVMAAVTFALPSVSRSTSLAAIVLSPVKCVSVTVGTPDGGGDALDDGDVAGDALATGAANAAIPNSLPTT